MYPSERLFRDPVRAQTQAEAVAPNNADLHVKVSPDIYLHPCWEDLNLFLAAISGRSDNTFKFYAEQDLDIMSEIIFLIAYVLAISAGC